jgi:hypothetical protein
MIIWYIYNYINIPMIIYCWLYMIYDIYIYIPNVPRHWKSLVQWLELDDLRLKCGHASISRHFSHGEHKGQPVQQCRGSGFGDFMVILWWFYGDFMVTLWWFHGDFIGFNGDFMRFDADLSMKIGDTSTHGIWIMILHGISYEIWILILHGICSSDFLSDFMDDIAFSLGEWWFLWSVSQKIKIASEWTRRGDLGELPWFENSKKTSMVHWFLALHPTGDKFTTNQNIYHLVMTNSLPWKIPTINGGL